jgi:hypothetical protein
VAVNDIDRQAKKKGYSIIEDKVHHYRASYYGKESEVNYYYYYYGYDITAPYKLLSELICIQLERFLKMLKTYNLVTGELSIIENVSKAIFQSIDAMFNFTTPEVEEFNSILISNINNYLDQIKKLEGKEIPVAPSRFTSSISSEGLKLSFENKVELSSINYQIFKFLLCERTSYGLTMGLVRSTR